MYIDIFLIILLFWAIFSGWRNGFIKELFNTLGVIVGLVIAAVLYYGFPVFLAVSGSHTNMLLSIGMFLILCILLPFFLGFIANRLTSAVKGMYLGIPNSLLGCGMSIVKFVLLVSFAFNIMDHLNIMSSKHTETSHLYEPTKSILPFVHGQAEEKIKEYQPQGDSSQSDTIWIDLGTKNPMSE